MKTQAASNLKAQASGGGGGPPPSSSLPATNCRATIYSLDTRSKVQAPRRKLVDNLNYFLRCHNCATLLWDIVGSNKRRIYGTNIRLQKLFCKRLVRSGLRYCRTFLLGSIEPGHPGSNSKKFEGDFFQIKFLKKNWLSGLQNRRVSRLRNQVPGQMDRLQIQCEGRTTVQVHPKMDQGPGRRSRRKIISLTSGPGRAIAPGFLIIIMNNCDKAQASSLTKAQASSGRDPPTSAWRDVMSH